MNKFIAGAAFGAGFVLGWLAIGQRTLERGWKAKSRNGLQDFWDMEDW